MKLKICPSGRLGKKWDEVFRTIHFNIKCFIFTVNKTNNRLLVDFCNFIFSFFVILLFIKTQKWHYKLQVSDFFATNTFVCISNTCRIRFQINLKRRTLIFPKWKVVLKQPLKPQNSHSKRLKNEERCFEQFISLLNGLFIH